MSYAHSLQIHGPECGVFGRSRHRGKCGSRQYQCGGDGRQRRERFPIARPRSRGSAILQCDAGPKQRKTAADPRWGIWELRRPERQRQLLFEEGFRSRTQLAGKLDCQVASDCPETPKAFQLLDKLRKIRSLCRSRSPRASSRCRLSKEHTVPEVHDNLPGFMRLHSGWRAVESK